MRVEEIAESRLSKMRSFGEFIEKKNGYLRDHLRASVSKALEKAKEKLKSLRIDTWVQVKEEGGILKIESDEEALKEERFLDGCYVIKTDLKEDEADKVILRHSRGARPVQGFDRGGEGISGLQDGEFGGSSCVCTKRGEYARACVCGNARIHDYPKTSQGMGVF